MKETAAATGSRAMCSENNFIMLNFAKFDLLRSVSFDYQSPNDPQTQNFLSRYKMRVREKELHEVN